VLDQPVRIVATVSPDLRSITGTIYTPERDGLRWVDPLALLPDPTDDRAAQRTWPGAPQTGWIQIRDRGSAGERHFRSILPARWGASGTVPGRGLFLNGLWYPQPVLADRLPTVRWEVDIQAPDHAVVAVNGAVAKGRVQWEGLADRLSLAVVPNGQVHRMELDKQSLILVDSGPRRPRRDARLLTLLDSDWPDAAAPPIVVIEAPMYRRLVRPGPGVVFISDRATRLTGGLWRHHASAIRRGLLQASIQSPDSWARGLAAHHLADGVAPGPTADQTLSWLAWIPGVDALLYDGSLPFTSEVMGETWPADPVKDDLLEVIENAVPSQVAVRKLTGLYGWDAVSDLVKAIMAGTDLKDAAIQAEIPVAGIEEWRKMPPAQNLSLKSRPTPSGGRSLTLTRETSADAPPEPVRVRVDGVDRIWIAGPGPDTEAIDLPRSKHQVDLDPGGDVQQTRRDDDGWPPRWTPTFAGGISELAIRQVRPTASAHTWMRRRYATRWVYGAHLGTDPTDLLWGSVSISRSMGPLMDRRTRAIEAWLSTGASLLDPAFRPTDQGATALDTWLGVSWDTRQGWPLPRRGHRLKVSTGAGWIAQSQERWSALEGAASGLLPLNHWATLSAQARGGMALGNVTHRRLALGGTGGVQGLATDAVVGDLLGVGSIELRTLPIRHASVPLPLAWGSHLQVSAGLDAGRARSEGTEIHAVGWSAGLAGVADILGARPTLGGIWVAKLIPPLTRGAPIDPWPQFYLRFRQAF